MRVFRVDYPEIVDQLIELFVESTPPLLDELREGAESGDGEAVRRAAHKLKGSCQNIGAGFMAKLAARPRAAPRRRRRPQLDGARPGVRGHPRRPARRAAGGRRVIDARSCSCWPRVALVAAGARPCAPRPRRARSRPSAACRALAAHVAGRSRSALIDRDLRFVAVRGRGARAPGLGARRGPRQARSPTCSPPTASRSSRPHVEAALAGEPGTLEWAGVRYETCLPHRRLPFREGGDDHARRCSRSATSARSGRCSARSRSSAGSCPPCSRSSASACVVADADGRLHRRFDGRDRSTTTCTRSSGPSTSACATPTARRSARTRRRCCARCAASEVARRRDARRDRRRPPRAARQRRAGHGRRTGARLGAVVVNADLTAFRDAEGRLRRSEERHRRVVESMVDCVFETDEPGRWTHLSENWTAATGLHASRTRSAARRGSSCTPTTAPRTRAPSRRCWPASASTLRHAHRFLTAAGAERWAEVQVRAISGWDGLPTGFVGVMRDVTDERRAQQHVAAEQAVMRLLSSRRRASRTSAPACSRSLGAELGWDGAELWRMGGDERLRRAADWTAPGVRPRALHRAPATGSATRSATASRARRGCRACRCGRPTSPTVRPRARDEALADGVRSTVALPLRAERRARSASSCSSRARRASRSRASTRLLEAIGGQVTQFLQRREAEAPRRRAGRGPADAVRASRTSWPRRPTCSRARMTLCRAVRDVTRSRRR